MDQVFFSVKRAHHATLRFMRPMLREFGLTPARFDLLAAVHLDDTQSGVQRRLGLARATISEMLGRLEELGFVWRTRFRRTKIICLTKKARELFRRAWEACLTSGYVPVTVDGVLVGHDAEVDPLPRRFAVEEICGLLRSAFGDDADEDLYPWHPDEYLAGLMDP